MAGNCYWHMSPPSLLWVLCKEASMNALKSWSETVSSHQLSMRTASRDEERRWRAEDLEQRALDNARVLWARFVEKNRRDVEERAEQLKGFSNLAALVAGFVMISYLQVGTFALHFQLAHTHSSCKVLLSTDVADIAVVMLCAHSTCMPKACDECNIVWLQFGFDSSTQNPNVLIGFGLTTAIVVSSIALLLPCPIHCPCIMGSWSLTKLLQHLCMSLASLVTQA